MERDAGPIKVLLIEDEAGDAGLIRRALHRSPMEKYAVTWVTTLASGLERLAGDDFDLVLIDLSLPDSSGLETVRAGCRAAGSTPVLVLTGRDDPEFALSTLDAGARDYLVKGDLDDKLLFRSLHYALARARTEAKLRESEERMGAILRAAENVSIVVTDVDHFHPRILEFSRGAERIFGYSREEMLGEKVEILHLPEDAARFPEKFEDMYKQQQGFSGESVLLRKSGEQFPALFTTYPLFDRGGRMWGTLGVSIDISERKRMEEALRQSEEKFRQLADSVGEVFWLRSIDNTEILYVNKAYERIWGRSRESLYANPHEFMEAIHDDDKERVFQEYATYLQDHNFNMEYRIVQPAGEIKWIWSRSFPVKDEWGNVVRYSGIAVDVTELKAAEQALQEKEEYLREILESQLDLVVRVDNEGRFVYVNEAYCRTFGKSREELLGQRFAPLVHPDDLPGAMQAMKKLYVRPYWTHMEQRAKTVRGWRWLAWHNYAIRDAEGTTREIQGVGRDITEQKQAEEKLQAVAEKYRTILATTRDGFWITDLQGRFLEVNDAYCKMTGYTQQELLAMSIPDIEAAESSLKTAQHIQKVKEEGADLFETRHRHKNGSSIDVEVSVTFLETDGGILIVFLRDITERKDGEKRLKASEERFRRIFDEGPLGMALINLDGQFLIVNDELCQLLGYGRQELLELSLLDVTEHEDRHLYLAQLRELAAEKIHSSQQEFRLVKKSGEMIWVNLTKTIIHDQAGSFHHYLAMLEDITERIETVDKLAEYTAKTELANLELENARDIALAASRAKSDFLSVMSHEIRTPMNSIMGMADLLAETSLSAEQAEYVRVFSAAGETLLGLINDILDLSKIEAGRLELEEHNFDLSEMLLKTIGLFSMKAQDKGLQLSYSILPGVPVLLRGDEGRLRQILLNLLGNAIKFTRQGEIKLTVEKYSNYRDADGEETGHGKAKLLFAVKDTGIGIPEERLKAVFEEFTQVDSSITRQFGGTGLGLTISRRLAERLGGSIWVESLLGLGSTFYFTVVYQTVKDEGVQTGATATSMETNAAAQTVADSLHILLVEDNADNRLLVKTFLKKTPHRVSVAENGAEALTMVKETNYNLILMDIQMPVMDGYTATKEIRSWEEEEGRKRIPIIALTAYALREEVLKALDAGCDTHLAKPVKKDVLLKTIAELGGLKHNNI